MKKDTNGFSIVEFIIAMGLSMLVLSGVISIYIANKTSTNTQNAIALLQNNGRYASFITNKHLRMAGYQGCINPNNLSINNIVKPSSAHFDKIDFTEQVNGYSGQSDGTFSPTLPSYLQSANIKANTDVIEVRYAEDLGIRLSMNMPNVNSALVLTDADGDGDLREGIAQGDVFLITDCETGDIAAAGGNANAASISINASQNTTVSLSKAYTTNARIYQLRYFAFYIKDTGRVNNSGAIIYGLYQMDIEGAETEIADGVEDFQLQYGIDTTSNGSADTFYDANTTNASNLWQQVMSIKVNRLLNSINEIDSEKRAYFFNGDTYTSSDRLIRREWSNFISLRNRSFP